MVMSEKIKRYKSKKAFTLVELVIVIAILAILVAVAIPVITTTINSAKLSTLESNAATIEMLTKEAINAYKADMKTEYNKKRLVNATLEDVLLQANMDLDIMSVHEIGKEKYAIYWETMLQGTSIHSGSTVTPYSISTRIAKMAEN